MDLYQSTRTKGIKLRFTKNVESMKRTKERLLLATATLLLVIMAFSYLRNITPGLNDTNNLLKKDSIVILSSPLNTKALTNVLQSGDYFNDPVANNFIASQLTSIVTKNGTLPNLGSLNKIDNMVEPSAFDQAGIWGQGRLKHSQLMLGLDSATLAGELSPTPPSYPSSVNVTTLNSGISFTGAIINNTTKEPVAGVLVKLTEEYAESYKDSISNSIITDAPLDSLINLDLENLVESPSFYARTGGDGKFEFYNLTNGKNYSIIPLKPGHEYGPLKGMANVQKKGASANSINFNFTENPHRLKLFETSVYQRIKADKVFIVRSPTTFPSDFKKHVLFFILGFWLLHIVLSLKKNESDNFILPLIMMICGTGLIILYSIQDPLRDEIYGNTMAKWAAVSLLMISALAFFVTPVHILKFLEFDYLRKLNFRVPGFNKLYDKYKTSRGYFWLVAAIAIMLLLAAFGKGPEGSGVKVNLGPIQVSEISKYLMVIFFAKYFTANFDYFRKVPDNKWLLGQNILMISLFTLLLLIYILTGDLGPAIVICLTFLVFFSIARNEFIQMILGGVLFGIVLFTCSTIFPGDSNLILLVTVIVNIALLIFSFISRKYKSIFFLIFLISSFIFLERVPADFTQRLADRNGMYENIWENQLNGGDQVAQGVWSLSSGGLWGQGLGKGFSNVMPAYHTDMILESIGEEIGILSLIAIFGAFLLLFYRILLSARRTGETSLYYFISGVGVVTIIQLSIIAGGSLGLIPLTGISAPFLSKGNSGLMINLFMFGVILIASHTKSDVKQAKRHSQKFDNLTAFAILSFAVICLLFIGKLGIYQFQRDINMIKPSMVLSKKGEWMYSYNPRISIISNELKSGNIFDRDSVLLATSDREQFITQEQTVLNAGANSIELEKQKYHKQKRYYPFGSDLVFWLGDANTNLVTNENAGYVAEFRHLTLLRGFETRPAETKIVTSDRFKETDYLPVEIKESSLTKYDYSVYIPFLKAGKNSSLIKKHNKQNRDIRISLDVKLNQAINTLLYTDEDIRNYKASVVVLNPVSGEVLASAQNPAPIYDNLRLLNSFGASHYNKLLKAWFGYNTYVSDRDYGLFKRSVPGSSIKILDALACLNRYGTDSAGISYYVSAPEIIRNGKGAEPFNETIDMQKAIVKSSNIYFIRLVNEKNLHQEIFDIHNETGINLYNRGGYYLNKPAGYSPQIYNSFWLDRISKNKENYYLPEFAGQKRRYQQSDYSWMAWGQGPVEATPLQMARVTGSIANNGKLTALRFLLSYSGNNMPITDSSINIQKKENICNLLESYMHEQSTKVSQKTGLTIYGKTGSPERKQQFQNAITKETITKTVTDGWYIFYIKNTKYQAPLSFAIRIEGKGASGNAIRLAEKILNKLNGLNYFPGTNSNR